MVMNENSNIIIREATVDDINLINDLANKIWPVTYKEILSANQLKYMMEMIYSKSSLQKQFEQGHNFLIVEDDNKPIAFADYSLLKDAIYKLNKIYVLPDQQGKSIGKMLINYLMDLVKQKSAAALWLNVNRNNKAKEFYEHLGFKIIREEDIDIGSGYFMNDFIMSYEL